jgi:galactonate dehydratase
MLDPASCRAWAQQIKQQPEGFTAFKIGPDSLVGGVAMGRYVSTLNGEQLRRVARGFANLREAVGDQIDLGVHCHNEYDTPSAIGIAKAVEPIQPMFLEDPLNVPYSEGWMALKRSSSVPILTGEKLELVRGFKPFLDNQAVDYIHPDLAFAGGFTGTKKIADYAALTRTPVALHNVGSLALCYANAHFGASIQNFFRSESALGRPNRYTERMARSNPPVVRNGMLSVPEGPGLGLDLDEDFLRSNLAPGEPYWE